jgi:hypothetical protein
MAIVVTLIFGNRLMNDNRNAHRGISIENKVGMAEAHGVSMGFSC